MSKLKSHARFVYYEVRFIVLLGVACLAVGYFLGIVYPPVELRHFRDLSDYPEVRTRTMFLWSDYCARNNLPPNPQKWPGKNK